MRRHPQLLRSIWIPNDFRFLLCRKSGPIKGQSGDWTWTLRARRCRIWRNVGSHFGHANPRCSLRRVKPLVAFPRTCWRQRAIMGYSTIVKLSSEGTSPKKSLICKCERRPLSIIETPAGLTSNTLQQAVSIRTFTFRSSSRGRKYLVYRSKSRLIGIDWESFARIDSAHEAQVTSVGVSLDALSRKSWTSLCFKEGETSYGHECRTDSLWSFSACTAVYHWPFLHFEPPFLCLCVVVFQQTVSISKIYLKEFQLKCSLEMVVGTTPKRNFSFKANWKSFSQRTPGYNQHWRNGYNGLEWDAR